MTEAPRPRLDYTFRRPELLRQALTHRSFGAPNNERMEFVGDAVLNCVVGAALYERFPALPEGDLSRMRAGLVKEETLARVARQIDLGPSLLLAQDTQRSGGAQLASILSDALEALFGAVFLDGGYDAARSVVVACYGDVLRDASPVALRKDPKTRLQEWLQARKLPVPEYSVTTTAGEHHEQRFTVECRIPRLGVVASGAGTSRRAGEQAAADAASLLVAEVERKGAGDDR